MHCEVILEIGHNHCGSLEIALDMLDAAKAAGADAVKFQKRDNKTLFTEAFYNAPYNSENAYGRTYGEHREALELGPEAYAILLEATHSRRMRFYVTAFDLPSLAFCVDLGVDGIKIASGDLRNTPLLLAAAKTHLPLYVSTGAAEMADVERAVETVRPHVEDLVLMQCTASYPCSPEELDLGVIQTYQRKWPYVTIGASLHDNGIWSAVAAYMLGARSIEKHFTLDRTMKGTDHAFSLEPQGAKKLVRDLRRAEVALGKGEKTFRESEAEPYRKMGKAVYTSRDLSASHVLTEIDLVLRSPAEGLPPFEREALIGQRLLRPLSKERPISWEDVDVRDRAEV